MTDAQIKRAMNLNEDIDSAVAYLEDTGNFSANGDISRLRAALREIGYADKEITAYLNPTLSKGTGGGKGQQTVAKF